MSVDLSTPGAVQAALHKVVDGMRGTLEFCLSQDGGGALPLIKLTVTDHTGERIRLVVGVEPAEDDES